MKGYVAQIDGFTMVGTTSEIQHQWDEIKSRYSKTLIGKTIKFFAANLGESYNVEFNGVVIRKEYSYTIENTKPVKEMVFNG